MTTDRDGLLPQWGGVTEPMTVLTNVLLACVAFVLGTRLAYGSAATGMVSAGAIGFGFLSTALAAVLGAAAHGLDRVIHRELRERCWNGALYAMGVAGAASIAAVAYFVATGPVRTTILIVAAVKLVVYLVRVARKPEFRIAAVDYAGGLAVLLAGAVYAYARWHTPGAPWLIGGVLVSIVAGVVQGRRLTLHRHFNHNDVYHVIQIAALYLLYRGGALLADR